MYDQVWPLTGVFLPTALFPAGQAPGFLLVLNLCVVKAKEAATQSYLSKKTPIMEIKFDSRLLVCEALGSIPGTARKGKKNKNSTLV